VRIDCSTKAKLNARAKAYIQIPDPDKDMNDVLQSDMRKIVSMEQSHLQPIAARDLEHTITPLSGRGRPSLLRPVGYSPIQKLSSLSDISSTSDVLYPLPLKFTCELLSLSVIQDLWSNGPYDTSKMLQFLHVPSHQGECVPDLHEPCAIIPPPYHYHAICDLRGSDTDRRKGTYSKLVMVYEEDAPTAAARSRSDRLISAFLNQREAPPVPSLKPEGASRCHRPN
ncbi:hypothetical protein EVAR_101464_1, partial [Eumeta japonica]